MSTKQRIELWLKSRDNAWNLKDSGISLFLPNGSYGRPFEDGRKVYTVNEKDGKLEILIEDDISLTFYGQVQFREEDSTEYDCMFLIFSGFDRMELRDYQGLTEFDSGEVRFASGKTLKERGRA